MGRRRRLRKSGGGELEVNKQDVVVSDEAIPPSVAMSNEAILLPYVVEEMKELLSHMLLH
jgi:hypothetical protein